MTSSQPAVCQRILLTPGEPAGIGPDITLATASRDWPFELAIVADAQLLVERARQLNLAVEVRRIDPMGAAARSSKNTLHVIHQPLAVPALPGQLDIRNADYVLDCLTLATDACLQQRAAALVTGPLQKSIIIEAGHAFSGHTEFLAGKSAARQVVMMLTSDKMRVALLTTHLPLAAVSDAVSEQRLRQVLQVLHADLQQRFKIATPVIAVCGLNPHAGEGGHLGRQDQDIIVPCLQRLRDEGMQLLGPLPADTAFTPKYLEQCDAVLAMYHDQGLPVIKHASFGNTVNITLGLPFIRTSVDHGTALDIAGTGKAQADSLFAAIELAASML
ncbi:MAG: 4-hydroxythreonine-4-phosphate dehydrogenase PdxA [Pseudomonadales bacterium]